MYVCVTGYMGKCALPMNLDRPVGVIIIKIIRKRKKENFCLLLLQWLPYLTEVTCLLSPVFYVDVIVRRPALSLSGSSLLWQRALCAAKPGLADRPT